GGMNLTAFPGVTARQGEDRLQPVTNWRGYCSLHNFAAGATRGGSNACAGLIFEKMNASAKKGVNDRVGLEDDNAFLYGVKAYKSWFVFGDLLLALGAGITNLQPDQEGDIWTTIDQTIWDSDVMSGSWAYPHDGETHRHTLSAEGSIPWVKQQSGFAYAVLPEQTPGEVSLVSERRASKWDKLAMPNAEAKNKPEFTDIFQLSINHGREVTNDTYGYLVYAGQENPEKIFADVPVTVLSNTTDLQAAASTDGKVVQAIFYNPESVLKSGEHTFTVSAPCAFLAEFDDEGTLHLTVTDAEMNVELDAITVQIDGTQTEVIALPVEPHRGKPATVTVAL
ncbi:MAG TPA: polysaccharide lyase family 8 super-sandwich domain-containing protein, partial [Oceanipulchritudo sp.]|nr:polysaccharide lyase family 8 super-sandwich domain-containing protein [Oceanipulchritudo sp.]